MSTAGLAYSPPYNSSRFCLFPFPSRRISKLVFQKDIPTGLVSRSLVLITHPLAEPCSSRYQYFSPSRTAKSPAPPLSMTTPNQHEVMSSNANIQSFPTSQHYSTHFQGSASDSAMVGKEHSPKQPRVSFESDPCIGSISRGAHPSMYPSPGDDPPSLTHLSCKPQGMRETPRAASAPQSTQEIPPGIIVLRNLLGITTLLVPEVLHLAR